MTGSEYGTPGVDDEVLGVLTGQVPVRSMPVAGRYTGEPRPLDGEFIEEDDESQ